MKNEPEGMSDIQAVELLADAFLSQIAQAVHHAHDPFEKYSLGLQAKVFLGKEDFRQRCLNGYRLLSGLSDKS